MSVQVLVEPQEGLLGASAMVSVQSATRWSVLGEVVSVVSRAYADAVEKSDGAGAGTVAATRAAKARKGSAATRATAAEEAGEVEAQPGACGGACATSNCESTAAGGCGAGERCACADAAAAPSGRVKGDDASESAPLEVAAERGRSRSRRLGGSTNGVSGSAAASFEGRERAVSGETATASGGEASQDDSEGDGSATAESGRASRGVTWDLKPASGRPGGLKECLGAGPHAESEGGEEKLARRSFGQAALSVAVALLVVVLLSLLLASNVQLLMEFAHEEEGEGMQAAISAAGATAAEVGERLLLPMTPAGGAAAAAT